MTLQGPLGQLAGLLAEVAELQRRFGIHGRPVALGWATVELDRAAVELGSDLGLAADRFSGAAESFALGASCRVANDALPGGQALVLLEPVTEGRLAATLARFGECATALWLAVSDLDEAAGDLRARGFRLSAGLAGPFGPERLLLGGPVEGPHQLLIQQAGTILL